MNHGSLFSGIGGFDLAAQWAGWDNIFHCEWNDFGQRVLKHYWPNAISYEDITKVDFRLHRGHIDILTGGFPCQPYSSAGKRLGKEDERHLWPEMLRAIREIQPRWVVGENVLGLVNWNGGLVFDEVQADLEAEGYEVQPFILPAASTNAPHKRDRVWFVAYSDKCNDRRITREDESESGEERVQERNAIRQSVESSEVQRNSPDSRLQRQEKRQKQTMGSKQLCEKRLSSNPDSGRWYEGSKCQYNNTRKRQICTNEQNDGNEVWCDIGSSRSDRDATDSNTSRIHQQHIATESDKTQQFSRFSFERRGFSRFPTQSPICGGDDGLPTELDGITFPKWRNESIKAYGNAIVPQVVYQIFKAINQYEAEEVQNLS